MLETSSSRSAIDTEELERRRAVLAQYDLCDHHLAPVALITGVATAAPDRPIPEALTSDELRHRRRSYMPGFGEFVRRRPSVPPLSDHEWSLVADLFFERAQRRLDWRDIVDSLRKIVFTSATWADAGNSSRHRLRKSRPELWLELERRTHGFAVEHSEYGADMRALAQFARRYLARCDTRAPPTVLSQARRRSVRVGGGRVVALRGLLFSPISRTEPNHHSLVAFTAPLGDNCRCWCSDPVGRHIVRPDAGRWLGVRNG